MKKPDKVTGSDCLQYINKPIGICTRTQSWQYYSDPGNDKWSLAHYGYSNALYGGLYFNTIIHKIKHDTSKRVVGLVTDTYGDGGERVVYLGNETFSFQRNYTYESVYDTFNIACNIDYLTVLGNMVKPDNYRYSTPFETTMSGGLVTAPNWNGARCVLSPNQGYSISEIEAIDYIPTFTKSRDFQMNQGRLEFKYADATISNADYFGLTTDKNNTLSSGENARRNSTIIFSEIAENPLAICSGNILGFANSISQRWAGGCPSTFNDATALQNFVFKDGAEYTSSNNCSHAYNIILTYSEAAALRYLQDGTLPNDAFLYPLDFENLPRYSKEPTGDDDDDNGGDPDDDGDKDRITDVTPLVKPSLTPTVFNANNVYWLNMGQLSTFLTWFWYDIQQFSVLDPTTWDNLFDNIEGLYADLAQAVISVRYMPVNPDYIGGVGSDKPIKLAQVQTEGDFPTIDTSSSPDIQDIGSYQIEPKFNSYLDLPPYTEIQLYLPYYGYIDLDADIFMGHTLNIKAVYDWISGTIQYFLFVDDKFMVNMYLAKMCVDIPITLQSAYDRDRAIQNNTITALSGLMSAGASAVSGNPIGLALSAGAVASPQQSAPIKVEGMTGETGALYAPSRCSIIIRRPTTTAKGSAYARNVGYAWAKTATLNTLTGLTVCSNPRITFNGVEYVDEEGHATGIMILPLDDEINEIYTKLEQGVIL